MKFAINENEAFSFASITDTNARTVLAFISVDIHTEKSPHARAAALLYADMLISGAGKYTRAEFLDAITTLGASVSASISDGVCTFFIRSSSASFKKLLPLLEVMFHEPHFDKKELARVKQTVTNLLNEGRENTRAIAHEQLRNTLYGEQDRRYTHDEDSVIAAIASIGQKELKALHKTIVSLPWTCSVASDPVSVAALKKTLTRLQHTTVSPSHLAIHQQKPPQPRLICKDVPSKQNIDFSIGAPVPITLHHPDYPALRFALEVLGGHSFASRLMNTVREQEGLTYGIYASAETFYTEEQGYWRIMSFFSPEKSIQGLTSTYREISKLYTHGVTKEEVDQQKTFHHTKQALLNDSTNRRLNELHSYHLQKFSLEEIAEHKQKTLSLTVEEVNRAIAHYLNPELLTISAAGPVAGIKKPLQEFIKSVT